MNILLSNFIYKSKFKLNRYYAKIYPFKKYRRACFNGSIPQNLVTYHLKENKLFNSTTEIEILKTI